MAVLTGKKFIIKSDQFVKNDSGNYCEDVGVTRKKLNEKCFAFGKTEKTKFRLSNGIRVPLLTKRNNTNIEAFLKLDIIKTRNSDHINPIKPATADKENDVGFKVLKCPRKLSENTGIHKHGLLDKIGPYHWQTFREKSAVPHDARDKFYLGRQSDHARNNRYHEPRLPTIPRQRPWTVIEHHGNPKVTPRQNDQCVTPRKRRSMVMQFDNSETPQERETPNNVFQVRRMKTDVGRFRNYDKDDEFNPPKQLVILHGQRPLKCEFTRPRYGQRRNIPKAYMICLPKMNSDIRYKSAEIYRKYLESREADTKCRGNTEETKNSLERNCSQHSRPTASSVNGEKQLDKPETENQNEPHSHTHSSPTNEKSPNGRIDVRSNDDATSSIIKHVIPSGDVDISCVGIKSDGVMTPGYGYDTRVLQSVINVNQPELDPKSGLSDKT